MHIERRLLLSSAALAPTAGASTAQDLRIVVGFPPGGPLDIAARIVAPVLEAGLGVPVRVENRVGESGNMALREVARAAPDGGTLLLCGPVNVINMALFPAMDVDFLADLAPVASIARVPLILEVNASVPARSVAELIALARAAPGGLRVAYAGTGTPQHIAIELFQHMAGVRMNLVAYPGSAQALADLLRGAADVMFDPAPSSMPHVQAGRLAALATTGPARAAALPDLPTVGETLAGYEGGSWFGLAAPRGTPGAVIELLHGVVDAGLAQPAVQRALERLGATPMPGSIEHFTRFLATEATRYGAIIRAVGIRPAG